MIFVTIGTQAPFDRFIQIIDELASEIQEPIIAQTYKSKYKTKNIKTIEFLPPDEFNTLFDKARLIVSHAGMGTIISALNKNKPIIIFPRIASLGEHRNDHQMATAKKMEQLKYTYAAYNAEQLKSLILTSNLQPLYKLGDFASNTLIQSIAEFINK